MSMGTGKPDAETRAPERSCVVIGLMGGIGSGKTMAAAILAEMGAAVLDADAICTELHETAEVKDAIRQRWGRAVLDANGKLDRAKLAAIAFRDPEELRALNDILHPAVIERIEQAVADCRARGAAETCVIDAALLLESGLIRLCDATIFIECDATTRARRLADTRGWAPDEIQRREAHQEPLARKRETANFVVTNSGDPAALREQIARIVADLKSVESRNG